MPYQPRNQNTTIISRWDLYMSLGAKYQHLGTNPFVLQKDGKQYYNILKDLVTFTCCPNTEHKFRMTPIQMMKLPLKYPEIPCPYCSITGEGNRPGKGGIYGETGDEGVFTFKKYLGDRNDMTNVSAVKDAIHRAAEDQKKENDRKNEEAFGIESSGNSMSLEEYMRRHPDYKPRAVIGAGAEKINQKINKTVNKFGDHDGPPVSTVTEEMTEKMLDTLSTPSNEEQLSEEDAAILAEMTNSRTQFVQTLQQSPQNFIDRPTEEEKNDQVKPFLNNILSDTENENQKKNIIQETTNNNDDDEEEEISYEEIKKSV